MRFPSLLLPGAACLIGSPCLQAQSFGLNYDTELQTDFRGHYNWVNLLQLNAAVDLSNSLTLQASTISVAQTSEQRLVDDMQGFSNIEADNLPLGIAVLGAEWRYRRSTFFLGIRNVNEDYFTSPLTSLFVNSSCGIFPTISGNYDLANYPLASWCLHYKAEWEKFTVHASLYEGLGHSRIAGHDNVFKFSPGEDGIFTITSAEYRNNGSNYSLGCALYYGVHSPDELLIEESPSTPAPTRSDSKKKASVAPWLNVEQSLTSDCSLLLQASYAPAAANCRYYFGLGGAYTLGKAQLGIFADYAKYKTCSEIASELTCCLEITPILSLQPAVELIHCGSHTDVIGIMRLSIAL